MGVQTFTSERQERLFGDVLRQVEALGYRNGLLARQYRFPDWFTHDNVVRTAPAAAFGSTPHSYASAFFAVLLPNGRSGIELVADYRALGAPFAFEVREDSIVYWKVGRDVARIREELRIPPDALDRVFRDREPQWGLKEALRLKNVGIRLGPQQGDLFVDSGLIPALEEQIQTKLNALLHGVIADAEKAYRQNTSRVPDAKELFRLVFRFLAAKVLHDRGHPPFNSLTEFSDADAVLENVGRYYREEDNQPLADDSGTQRIVGEGLWKGVDFRNISVEALAYVYENTLVDEDTRRRLGTHSTPHNIARYIVHHLPFEDIGEDAPLVVEPFSGHGIFLVAALQRLREFLPRDMDEKERHSYFVKRLRGYEIDSFATEVSKLCLMLADFPNHNGWQLRNADVFLSKEFATDLGRAGVVLCNPPFEDFSEADRAKYSPYSLHKPEELMHRVLDAIPRASTLGVVLPRAFLDGTSYRHIRERLAKHFDEIETVGLPDRVFRKSQQTSALLIAKTPRRQDRPFIWVTYTHVADKDRNLFLSEYGFTRRDSEVKSLDAARDSLKVVALREIWNHLESNPKLSTIASDIHRGVEWLQPFDEEKYIANVAKPGFERGFHKVEGIQCFQPPAPTFLCTKPQYRRRKAWVLPWQHPKVLFNVCRISRGQWCLAAFDETSGLIASENFGAIWPTNHWTPRTLAAVLNGPIANAFIASRESEQQRIRLAAIRDIPIPTLGPGDVATIDGLVDKYVRLIRVVHTPRRTSSNVRTPPGNMGLMMIGSPELSLFGDRGDDYSVAREVLLEIDATILKAYSLPPRMERDVLDFFRDVARPVPFVFDEYFPESFVPTIPLWMYLSEDFKNCTGEYFLKNAPDITDPALIEALKDLE